MRLKSIQIKKLRSLTDTGDIQIRPLTFLVGTNSSGKSTFLRTFPLLRQSIETSSRGPILWYGKYVDFGSFKEALQRGATSPDIDFSFSFSLQQLPNNTRRIYHAMALARFFEIPREIDIKCEIILGNSSDERDSFAKAIKIQCLDYEVYLEADEKGKIVNISINGDEFNPKESVSFRSTDGFIPQIFQPIEDMLELENDMFTFRPIFGKTLVESIRDMVVKRKARPEYLVKNIGKMGFRRAEEQFEAIRTLIGGKSKTSAISNYTDRKFTRIRNCVFFCYLPFFIESMNAIIAHVFKNMQYIAPVRATAERFYRYQGVQVSEVDPQGTNLAMFFNSMSPLDRKEFSEWALNTLGFAPAPISYSSHLSLNVQEEGSIEEFNMADKGFGFSQVLPVLIQLWMSKRKFNNSEYNSQLSRFKYLPPCPLLVVEQPELHLHPRLQSKLTDAFVSMVKQSFDNSAELSIICETHSEAMVNRLGALIERGKLDPRDVQILLFEREPQSLRSAIRTSEFTADGRLTNWPFGFFLGDD